MLMSGAPICLRSEQPGEGDVDIPEAFSGSNECESPRMTGEVRRVRGSSKRRMQRYRPAWEDMPECSLWLSAHVDPYKAVCQICDKVITADLAVVRAHAIAKKHLVAEQRFYQTRQRSQKTPQISKNREGDNNEDFESGDFS